MTPPSVTRAAVPWQVPLAEPNGVLSHASPIHAPWVWFW
jgi:hypothetical protein